MYRLFIIFFLLLTISDSQAQIKKGKQYLAKGAYALAIEAFENDLEKAINRPVALEQLASVFLNKNYKDADIKKAYKYLERAVQEYDELSSKNRKKLQKKGISKIAMSKKMKDIIAIEQKTVEREQSVLLANTFLMTYKANCNNIQLKNIHTLRNQLALKNARKKNSYDTYKKLIDKYEISFMEYSPSLYKDAQKEMLETYIAEKSWAMYPAFEEEYKDNPYVLQQKEAYELIKIYRKRSMENMKKYIAAYPNTLFIKFAKKYLHEQTLLHGNLTDIDYFIRTYPTYSDDGKMWRYFYKMYTKEHGDDSVIEFMLQYPQYPYQKEIEKDYAAAKIHQEKPVYDAALKSQQSKYIVQFIQRFPDSELVKEAEIPLAEALLNNGSFRYYQFFLKQYPKSTYYDKILDKLYDAYTYDGEFFSVNQFMIDYPEYQNTDKLKQGLDIGQKGKKITLNSTFDPSKKKEFEAYVRIAAPSERAFVALQRMIENELKNKKWDAALTIISQFESYFDENPKVAQLKKLLQEKNLGIQKINLGPNVNTSMDEYIPIISVNNESLYFCRWDKTNENIYLSEKKNGQWQKANYVEGLNINKSGENEGPLSISADNNEIIIFKNGDLYSAKRDVSGWQATKALSKTINTNRWEADAMISSDGKALLFSSKRPDLRHLDIVDTKDYHGDEAGNADLFVSLKGANGKWQQPINLGDIINTQFLERTPFLHPDMKTLYFSSDGHGGLGRLDVYKTTRLDDTWTNWSSPINLGKNINTPENDWGYKISTNGEIAYFAYQQKNENGQDLYKVTLPKNLRPEQVSIIAGNLNSSTGNPIFADIVWENLRTGKEVGRLKSDPNTGEYFITLPHGELYSYYLEKEGYFPKANHIDLTHQKNSMNIQEAVTMFKITEMVDNGQKTPLKNLFFDPNRFTIKETSFATLNRLAKIIRKYNLKIEIAGHTDSTGDQESNLILSTNRAKAVKDYLIEQGCSISNIQVKGFGDQQPLANNTTEEGRKKNRRVEVRFMK